MWTKFLRYFSPIYPSFQTFLSVSGYVSWFLFLSYSKPQTPECVGFLTFSISFFLSSSFLCFWSCLDIFCLSRSFLEKDRLPRFPVSNLHPSIDAQATVCPPIRMTDNTKSFSVPWDIHGFLFNFYEKHLVTNKTYLGGRE